MGRMGQRDGVRISGLEMQWLGKEKGRRGRTFTRSAGCRKLWGRRLHGLAVTTNCSSKAPGTSCVLGSQRQPCPTAAQRPSPRPKPFPTCPRPGLWPRPTPCRKPRSGTLLPEVLRLAGLRVGAVRSAGARLPFRAPDPAARAPRKPRHGGSWGRARAWPSCARAAAAAAAARRVPGLPGAAGRREASARAVFRFPESQPEVPAHAPEDAGDK